MLVSILNKPITKKKWSKAAVFAKILLCIIFILKRGEPSTTLESEGVD